MLTNGALARLLFDIVGAFVDVVFGPFTSAPAGGSTKAAPRADVDEPDALPDSQTLVARIQAWRASGASMVGIESQSSSRPPVEKPANPADRRSEGLEPAPVLPSPSTQPSPIAVAAASAATPSSQLSGAPAAEPAPVSVSLPVDVAGGTATPTASPALNEPAPSALPAVAAVMTPAAQATPATPVAPAAPVAQTTPPDLVAIPGQPGTFVSRSAFAQLGLANESAGAPLSATALIASPARSGAVDTAAIAAMLAAQGVDRSPPSPASVNDLPQSPALSGHVDTQQAAALGLPSRRDADSFTAVWNRLPAVPIVVQTGAPVHAPAGGPAAAPPVGSATGVAGDAPGQSESTMWPSLPEWPLPWDDAGAERGSLRERVEASWYV